MNTQLVIRFVEVITADQLRSVRDHDGLKPQNQLEGMILDRVIQAASKGNTKPFNLILPSRQIRFHSQHSSGDILARFKELIVNVDDATEAAA